MALKHTLEMEWNSFLPCSCLLEIMSTELSRNESQLLVSTFISFSNQNSQNICTVHQLYKFKAISLYNMKRHCTSHILVLVLFVGMKNEKCDCSKPFLILPSISVVLYNTIRNIVAQGPSNWLLFLFEFIVSCDIHPMGLNPKLL